STWGFAWRTVLALIVALAFAQLLVWQVGNPLTNGQTSLTDGLSRLSASDWAATSFRALSGFVLGTIVALLLAQLGHRSGLLRETFEVVRTIVRWTPMMALGMVFLFGYGTIHIFAAFATLAVVLQSLRPDGPVYGATWIGLRAALQAAITWCAV